MSNKTLGNPRQQEVNFQSLESIREQISEALEEMTPKEGKKFLLTIITDCKTHSEALEDASEDDDDADDDQEMKPSRDNDEEKDDDSFGMHEVEAP
jgi:DNA mismatch repair ATPase MutL